MSNRVLEIRDLLQGDRVAEQIAGFWVSWQGKRNAKIEEWKELRNYLFATDTTTTSNSSLPWKNTTTMPKLCQIRDNLHANYMSALFPNDDWLTWEGGDDASVDAEKSKAILAYMKNKLQEGEFEKVISALLYDYIDSGNPIADCEYVEETHTTADGEVIPGYIGPKALRHSIFDIVFNPMAVSFRDSPKITRYVKTLGSLKVEAETRPEFKYNLDIIRKVEENRKRLAGYDAADLAKATGLEIDGFGTISDYFGSENVEILEFEGDIHDEEGNLQRNRLITIIDRLYVIRNVPHPSWFGKSTKLHAGWRPRPDNLYAMGPLDNLVGMQYRIDHLENLKADAMDLAILPPIATKGNVETFEWAPMEHIDLGDDGEIFELGKNISAAMTVDTQIAVLEQRMEEMAGAPKQAMGIRTPGEKTAFEVQTLENAASRIFQEKLRNFEIYILEPLLNNMLEVARRNINSEDLVRVMDDDLGVIEFLKITKADITAKGKLRPIGAKHFAAQAQLVQNLNMIFNSSIGQIIMPHVSSKKLARMVESLIGSTKFDLIQDNIAVFEQIETKRIMQQGEENLEVEAITPDEMQEGDEII